MITFEALDVILRVQNLPGFMARMRAGARSVRQIGLAAADTNKKTSAAIYAAARKATLGLTAMAAIAAATGYKQSVEFQKQLTLVHTQAGATMAEMKAFKEPLLDMAKTLPQGPIELAKGLYHIKSIGIPAAQALDALKIAAQGAMVGNADLEQTTSALGAAWLAGIDGAGSFRNTMAILNATVGAGNMRMDELVTALGTGVLPTAKLAGLSIQDVMGALALLKDEGYGAYGAMAQFATALHFFTDPTKKAQDAFKKLGLSQLDLADLMRKQGMVPTLALLRDRLKLTGDEMARLSKHDWSPITQQEKLLGDILPGGRGRVFRVLLNQVDRYQMKLDQINRTSKNFGGAIATTQQTAAARLHIAWSSIQVDLIRLGDMIRGPGTDAIVFLMGVFESFLKILIGIPGAIRTVINIWQGLPFPIRMTTELIALMLAQFALIRAAITIIYLMRAAWLSVRLTIMAVRGAMILLFMGGGGVTLLIMAAIAALVLMITHWKETKQAARDVWNYIQSHDWTKVLLGVSAILVILIGQFYAVRAAMVAWGIAVAIFNAVRNGLMAIRIAFLVVQAAMGPIGWILLGISLALMLIILKWDWVKQAAMNAWHWIVDHWKLLAIIIGGPFAAFAVLIINNWHRIRDAGVGAWYKIKHAFNDVINFFTSKWQALTNSGFVKFFTHLMGGGGSPGTPSHSPPVRGRLGSFHPRGGYTGGAVTAGGALTVGEHGIEHIFLPGGSFVQPAGFRAMPGGASSSANPGIMEVHVHSYLDGKEVAESVSHHQLTKKARK